MIQKSGSSGGNEPAVAYHFSSRSELCLILSKAQMRRIEMIYVLFLFDFQSNFRVRLLARNEQNEYEPLLEESRDSMETIVCSGYTGRHLKLHQDLWMWSGVKVCQWVTVLVGLPHWQR
jgi:hypothetical protein